MQHIMLDLETLSIQPNAHILSIGACKFDAKGVHEQLKLNIIAQEQTGAHIDPLTVQWWLGQSKEAKNSLTGNQVFLSEALQSFFGWMFTGEPTNVWGNGSDFDNVILLNAYQRLGMRAPWKFYDNRCYRTVKNLFPIVPKPKPAVKHDSLSDAIAQAEHLIQINSVLVEGCGIDLFDTEQTKHAFGNFDGSSAS